MSDLVGNPGDELLNSEIIKMQSARAFQEGVLHGLVVVAGSSTGLNFIWNWGLASVSPARREMTPDSVFDVASITKVVATSTAAAICMDRGLLDPNAPAREYLPRLGQYPGSAMKVCDLATHYSGYDNRKFDKYSSDRLLAEAIEAPAQWPARERFEYSCRNFIVLGQLIERVTGESLAEFCKKNIFDPIGMKHTCFGPIRNGENIVPTEQTAGTISDGQARKAGRTVGNAGLFSSAGDLELFCQMMLNGGTACKKRILSPAAHALLMNPCSPANLPRRSFGWDMRSLSDFEHRPAGLSDAAIGHGGWTGQSVWIDPEAGIYAVVLTNRTHGPINGENYDASMCFRKKILEITVAEMKR